MQIGRLKVNGSPIVVNWQRQHVDMRTVVIVVVIPRVTTRVTGKTVLHSVCDRQTI